MKHSKTILWVLVLTIFALSGFAQNTKNGAITPDILMKIRNSVNDDATTKALINAVTNNGIQQLALNRENESKLDMYFSDRIKTKGITDQKSSGRCWLYTGLNVIRAAVIDKYDMEKFELSQTYPFFFDQLEKANLFLEGIIETAGDPMDNKRVEWLFDNPIGDGGQWTGVVDVVGKYGLVPYEIMPNTKQSESTRWMSRLLRRELRKQALELRTMKTDGASAKKLEERKIEMLGDIYRILTLSLGEPPAKFQWRYKKSDGSLSELKSYTPLSFFHDFVNMDLNGYVMFMNDPSRDYYKLYEIDYDRHILEGGNWKYINLPADMIKTFAVKSIKNKEAMYFSCDVGKQLNKDKGTLDLNNYDYNDLFGVDFDMDKTQRIETGESGSTHGMNLIGVDLDANGNPRKWLLENSWGASSGFNGFLIMTDDWFNEYMFRLVVRTKYVTPEILKILSSEPVLLPPWDPMFTPEK